MCFNAVLSITRPGAGHCVFYRTKADLDGLREAFNLGQSRALVERARERSASTSKDCEFGGTQWKCPTP
ncbi:hypothetical protein C8Q79DRAFT_980262 [Trametes meyenii]|nr:hypothetical protein C8Q79DRAFT_980262 [Trametes meyenii]